MKTYALSFMTEIGFDDEAIEALSSDLERMLAEPESKAIIEKQVALYETDVNRNYGEILSETDKAAEIAGVHKYSAELLIFILFSKRLRELYKQSGISDKIWFDSMCDLKWKLWECKAVKGSWGSFVAGWFPGFFNLTRFALGRLQFEIVEFDGEYEKDGKKLFYGCDGAWMMTATFNYLCNSGLDMMVLDGTVGDYEGDFRMAEHNSIPMIRLMLPSLKTKEIVTEKTKVYISHLAPRLHKSHAETVEIVKNDGICVAYDGLTVEI